MIHFSNDLVPPKAYEVSPAYRRVPLNVDLPYLEGLYRRKEPISALVLCDAYGAQLAEGAGIEIVVAAFSNGGTSDTPSEATAKLSDAVKAVKELKRVNSFSLVVGDVPQCCYKSDRELLTAARLLIANGADAVKIEGGAEMSSVVRQLTEDDIPVVGHIGYTPKTGMKMTMRGKTLEDVKLLHADATELIDAGAKALVFELIRSDAAAFLTQRLFVPTIGIYSGAGTSGQVLVLNDILGITEFDPKFFPKGKPKSIGNWQGSPATRTEEFYDKVKSGEFPFRAEYVEERELTLDEMWTPTGGHYK